MKRFILSLVTAFVLLAPAVACPLCKEAIPASGDDQNDYDPARQSMGYNYSIYFMLVIPASLVGAMGVVIYRQCRKVDQTLDQ